MNNKICILYPPGGYGTFIEWVINYLTDKTFPEDLPFTKYGNSHGNRPRLKYIDKFSDLESATNTCRMHPIRWDSNTEELLTSIEQHVAPRFPKVVFVEVADSSLAWLANNFETKVDLNSSEPSTYIDRIINDADPRERAEVEAQLAKFGADDIENIEPWILRDFYSGHLPDMNLKDYQSLAGAVKQNYPGWLYVDMNELKENLIDCVIKIAMYSDRTIVEERVSNLVHIESEWRKKQVYIDHDELVDSIVDSIVNKTDFEWSDRNITLVDEALVINSLRKHQLEIKVFNLNKFPTSTKELLPLVIPLENDS